MKVRMKYGMEGYGIYFGIIEILREQSDYTLTFSDLDSISFDLRVDLKKIEDIISNYDLFEIEVDSFYSKSLKKRMEKLDLIKQKRADAGRASSKSRSNAKQVLNNKIIANKNIIKKSKVNIEFSDFWNLYDYKKGNKIKIEKKWLSLKDDERTAIMDHLPLYVASTPDKQWRKHPYTYLNNQGWEDEMVNVIKKEDYRIDSCGFPMAYCDKCGVSASYRQEELSGDSKCCNSKLLPNKPVLNGK
tara:strand:- start:1544 stop:2278 length:735 start_codon:yes stop_codon:yes gene_type:complete